MLIFKKTEPTQLIYQIDYREIIDDEYEAFMKEFGYTVLGQYYQCVILKSEDNNVEPIFSDKDSKRIAMKSALPIYAFIIAILWGILLIFETFKGNNYEWYKLYLTPGSFYLYFQDYLFRFYKFLLGVYVLSTGLNGLVRRSMIEQYVQDEEQPRYKSYIIKGIVILKRMVQLLTVIIICVGVVFYPKLLIYLFILSIICVSLCVILYWAEKTGQSVENTKQRSFIGVLVWVAISAIVLVSVFNSTELKSVKNYEVVQEAYKTTQTMENKTFYKRQITTGFIEVEENQESYLNDIYFEEFYSCDNEKIAKAIFQELIMMDEHIGRYYEDTNNRLNIRELERKDYDSIITKYKIKLDNQMIYMYDTYYVLEGCNILKFTLGNQDDLEKVLNHYLDIM